MIFAIFNISPDLPWNLEPTSLHFKAPFWEVLGGLWGASWAALGASWKRVGGRLGGVFGPSWGVS